MKMKWQFAIIFAAMYAVSPAGAVDGVTALTKEQLAQLFPNRDANGVPIGKSLLTQQDQDKMARKAAGPLDLLKRASAQYPASSADPNRNKPLPKDAGQGKAPEKPPKGGKNPKRTKQPSKKSQAKSR